MTASRRRAGDAMRRGIAQVNPAVSDGVTADRHDGLTAERQTVWSKYTVKFRPDTAAEFDALALRCRRRLNRRVDKSEIVTALIRLAADDASLADQIISELGQHKGPW